MKNQLKILKEIQASGYNVCTCGNCGDVVLLETKELIAEDIACPHCNSKMDYSDFPDLYTENGVKTSLPSREEILEYKRLHNEDEVGIDDQWDFEDAEYHLLLSDKYYQR